MMTMTMKVKELKDIARRDGIKGWYSMKKAELIDAITLFEKTQAADADKNAKADAKAELLKDFGRAVTFYKESTGTRKMAAEDYQAATELWQFMSSLEDMNTENIDTDKTCSYLVQYFAPSADISTMTLQEKADFVKQCAHEYKMRTTTEYIKKDQELMVKMDMLDLDVDTNGVFSFDKKECVGFEYTDANGVNRIVTNNGGKSLRIVATAEDGIIRLLREINKDIISVQMGAQSADELEMKELKERKEAIFRNGFIDRNSGKKYLFAFQNASGNRKADFLFVQAERPEEIQNLWLKLTGFATWNDFKNSNLFSNGKCVFSKLLTRISSRGSNSLDTSIVAEPKYAAALKNARVEYVEDVKLNINRPYYTIDRPGHLEYVEGERTVTPGDGQGLISFSYAALLATALRIISEDEYSTFVRLFDAVDKNMFNIKNGSKLDTMLKKIPAVFQIRHGEKKGILVMANLEAFPETENFDIIIPDSVRKYIGGEWSEYPLEVCNYYKKRGDYVALNPQFIAALQYENPNALNQIVDYWFDVMKASLDDIVKAQAFHGLIRNTDEDMDDDSPLLVQALRTSSSLVNESQVCNWRKDQYAKFIENMKIGRILVPGAYTYMITDPYALLNKWFGIDCPFLEAGEYHFNEKTCEAGMFRSPLIHGFEAQHVQLVNHFCCRYLNGVIVFNIFDGAWDRMGGGDCDGDTAEIITNDSDFGQLIVDGLQNIEWDVYMEGASAKKEEFTYENMISYLTENAVRDRTGIFTNYATRASDIRHHLNGAIWAAKKLGCSKIMLLHPREFMNMGLTMQKMNPETGKFETVPDKFGSQWSPRAIMVDGEKVFAIKGFVRINWSKDKKQWEFGDDTGKFGLFSFDEVEALANNYDWYVRYLRPIQGIEIDSAKTGKKPDDLLIDDIMVKFSGHCLIKRQNVLSRPVSDRSIRESYVSLSPLGRIHDYVSMRENEVLDFLENGSDKMHVLQGLLTEEEYKQLNTPILMSDGTQVPLVSYVASRKSAYNTLIREVLQNCGSDATNTISFYKDREQTELIQFADNFGFSHEVMAVACYLATYNKTSRQNEGLSYGWILASDLLSVFSRGNKSVIQIHVPSKAKELSISNGYLYVNGEKFTEVDAEDKDEIPMWIHDGDKVAIIRRKSEAVKVRTNTVQYNTTVYNIGVCGFKYHIASAQPLQAWKDIVKNNGFVFDIILDASDRTCCAVNGKTIGAITRGSSFDLVNKKVKIVGHPVFHDASVEMQVVIIGEAQ